MNRGWKEGEYGGGKEGGSAGEEDWGMSERESIVFTMKEGGRGWVGIIVK